jgi:hypothetical protein
MTLTSTQDRVRHLSEPSVMFDAPFIPSKQQQIVLESRWNCLPRL